ncbi:MAG TPA: type II toxin-antitoxin system VapC family toxin [Kofleriaceae bacterium]|nr:type II toxin-antitoxin system VapC family toxin [Kofleriaceae bacterium]
MRYLLDTQAFLWLAIDDPRLTPAARAIFVDSERECFLSAASVWEMSIKSSLGKLALTTSVAHLVRGGRERGIGLVDVRCDHAYLVEKLPFHHRDPFDRLLVAQAMHEGMHLVSCDEQLDAYPVTRIW